MQKKLSKFSKNVLYYNERLAPFNLARPVYLCKNLSHFCLSS